MRFLILIVIKVPFRIFFPSGFKFVMIIINCLFSIFVCYINSHLWDVITIGFTTSFV
jgi:hypothetical protein